MSDEDDFDVLVHTLSYLPVTYLCTLVNTLCCIVCRTVD